MPERVIPIHTTRRLVPVTFRRATTGAPNHFRPDLDERGFTGVEHGPLAPCCQGDTIIVHVVREHLRSNAPLFATSTAPAVAVVEGGAALPQGATAELKIRGVLGDNPKTAIIKIHFGSEGGPVIAQLGVWVYKPLLLRLQPHLVSITTAADAAHVPPVPPVAPTVKPQDVIEGVRRIWRPFGINFALLPQLEHTVNMSVAGQVMWGPEIGNLFAAHNPPAAPAGGGPVPPAPAKCIHIYFTHHCVGTAGQGYFGVGVAPSLVAANAYASVGINHPGIVVADEAKGAYALDVELQSAMVAHEIGHFLSLWHPEKKDANPPHSTQREDMWSRRSLMYPTLPPTVFGDWRDKLGYGTFHIPPPQNRDAPKNGVLITMKDLSQLITDGEATTARHAANVF